MNVVHLSFTDIAGGAARAAWRVHRSLDLAGSTPRCSWISLQSWVRRHTRQPDRGPCFWTASQGTPSGPAQGPHGAHVPPGRFRALLGRSHDQRLRGRSVGARCDIHHIHQITDFVDYEALRFSRLGYRSSGRCTRRHRLPADVRISYECVGFTRQCGGCPQLGSSDERASLTQCGGGSKATTVVLPRPGCTWWDPASG